MPVMLPEGTDNLAEARVAAVTEQQLAGVATGVGSLPGTDPAEATRTVFGELPDLPHVPELPARGAGADMIGRGAAFLVDLPVDLQPSGWRLVDRPGRDLRRSLDFLARDLDTLEDLAQDYAGPLKLQVAGPWTLAATVELHYGDKAVSDPGATRDLTQSLAEGVRRHVADMAGRLPGAQIVLQLDEPALPAVLVGDVPTASGFGTLRAVEEQVVRSGSPRCWRRRPAPARCRRWCTAARRTRRSRCSGRPGPARSRSTWPCGPRPTTSRSAARSRPAWASGWAWSRPGRPTTRPCSATWATRSGPYGGCGAGSASRPSCCPVRSC